MKRMRVVLGLLIGVLLVVGPALPAAVLAEETAVAAETETIAEQVAVETATAAEVQTTAAEAAIETAVAAETETTAEQVADESAAEIDTSPGEITPEAPAEDEADPGPGETTPESPAEDEADPGPGETTPESNAIEELISTVAAWNLQQGIENSLDSKLQNAKDSLTAANAGLREDAVNKLQAFINACEAQRDKALTTGQADELIEMANAIIASL